MSSISRLSPDDARDLIDGSDSIAVVDIRDITSFAAGRIEHARHLDDVSAQAFASEADPAVPVIVCCYHGHSSQQAAAWLASRGIEKVYSLDGGYAGWSARFPDDIESDVDTGVTL